MGLATWLGFRPAAPNTLQQTPIRPGFIDLIPEGMSLDEYLKTKVLSMTVEKLWREQPHLRTVVGFVARNIAQLGLEVFERDDDDGRNQIRAGVLHDLLAEPNDDVTQFELIESTVASRMLYDETYWYVGRDLSAPSGWFIRHIPTSWFIGATGATAFSVSTYRIRIPGMLTTQILEIPASDMIVFKGWNPIDPRSGVSPVESLKAVLAEQIHAQVFRNQMWDKGGRVGNWIYRPPPGQGPGTAPPWAPETRDKWIEEYRTNYSSDGGSSAGGTPLFEDGMELRTNRFSAKDEQFVEASKLSLSTVAQVYFVNPTMVGLLDNANYANVKEFRRALYGDNLGPEIERLQQRINRKLVPKVVLDKATARRTYTEFNLQTKLAGSFEEQGNLLFQAAGGPYMTRNEVRSRQNLPSIDGCDDLILPLNVTQNGDQNPIPADPASPGPDESTLPTLPPAAPEPDEPTKPPPKGERRNGHNNHRGGVNVRV
jgi:HK97 family phage portal protein